jgi:hypothetical protein
VSYALLCVYLGIEEIHDALVVSQEAWEPFDSDPHLDASGAKSSRSIWRLSFNHQNHLPISRAVSEAGSGIEDDSRNLLRSTRNSNLRSTSPELSRSNRDPSPGKNFDHGDKETKGNDQKLVLSPN